jgi:hypothetical protein
MEFFPPQDQETLDPLNHIEKKYKKLEEIVLFSNIPEKEAIFSFLKDFFFHKIEKLKILQPVPLESYTLISYQIQIFLEQIKTLSQNLEENKETKEFENPFNNITFSNLKDFQNSLTFKQISFLHFKTLFSTVFDHLYMESLAQEYGEKENIPHFFHSEHLQTLLIIISLSSENMNHFLEALGENKEIQNLQKQFSAEKQSILTETDAFKIMQAFTESVLSL